MTLCCYYYYWRLFVYRESPFLPDCHISQYASTALSFSVSPTEHRPHSLNTYLDVISLVFVLDRSLPQIASPPFYGATKTRLFQVLPFVLKETAPLQASHHLEITFSLVSRVLNWIRLFYGMSRSLIRQVFSQDRNNGPGTMTTKV